MTFHSLDEVNQALIDRLIKVWNDELATVAQRWADQCQFGHDDERQKLDKGTTK